MAARSRGVVRMMTRTITMHPKGVNWKDLESGKLWGKKKKYIHTHSYTQVVVHISMYDGEEA